MPLIFVYGTLMRGSCRSAVLRDEQFVGPATTRPRYRMYHCGGYPGLVECDPGVEIEGEVWRVSDECLLRLDDVEGTDEGLYARRPIQLSSQPRAEQVEAYFYLRDVTTLPEIGPRWSNEGIPL